MIPIFLGAAAGILGLAGVAMGVEASEDNRKAENLIDDANYIFSCEKNRLDNQRDATNTRLECLGELKLKTYAEELGRFVKVFDEFKHVDIASIEDSNFRQLNSDNTKKTLQDMRTASLDASEILGAGVSALGAGALAGIASYGGAMMFASASTGTAIAALSGAAATNATLAWFGGGSLAAGGLGMAGGTMVLGGIVAGPILAVTGFMASEKAAENLSSARATYAKASAAVEEMKTAITMMEGIAALASDYEDFILSFISPYNVMLEQLETLKSNAYEVQKNYFLNRIRKFFGWQIKVDFRKLSVMEQKTLQLAWLSTQVLHEALAQPLLKEDGGILSEAVEKLDEISQSAQKCLPPAQGC